MEPSRFDRASALYDQESLLFICGYALEIAKFAEIYECKYTISLGEKIYPIAYAMRQYYPKSMYMYHFIFSDSFINPKIINPRSNIKDYFKIFLNTYKSEIIKLLIDGEITDAIKMTKDNKTFIIEFSLNHFSVVPFLTMFIICLIYTNCGSKLTRAKYESCKKIILKHLSNIYILCITSYECHEYDKYGLNFDFIKNVFDLDINFNENVYTDNIYKYAELQSIPNEMRDVAKKFIEQTSNRAEICLPSYGSNKWKPYNKILEEYEATPKYKRCLTMKKTIEKLIDHDRKKIKEYNQLSFSFTTFSNLTSDLYNCRILKSIHNFGDQYLPTSLGEKMEAINEWKMFETYSDDALIYGCAYAQFFYLNIKNQGINNIVAVGHSPNQLVYSMELMFKKTDPELNLIYVPFSGKFPTPDIFTKPYQSLTKEQRILVFLYKYKNHINSLIENTPIMEVIYKSETEKVALLDFLSSGGGITAFVLMVIICLIYQFCVFKTIHQTGVILKLDNEQYLNCTSIIKKHLSNIYIYCMTGMDCSHFVKKNFSFDFLKDLGIDIEFNDHVYINDFLYKVERSDFMGDNMLLSAYKFYAQRGLDTARCVPSFGPTVWDQYDMVVSKYRRSIYHLLCMRLREKIKNVIETRKDDIDSYYAILLEKEKFVILSEELKKCEVYSDDEYDDDYPEDEGHGYPEDEGYGYSGDESHDYPKDEGYGYSGDEAYAYSEDEGHGYPEDKSYGYESYPEDENYPNYDNGQGGGHFFKKYLKYKQKYLQLKNHGRFNKHHNVNTLFRIY